MDTYSFMEVFVTRGQGPQVLGSVPDLAEDPGGRHQEHLVWSHCHQE